MGEGGASLPRLKHTSARLSKNPEPPAPPTAPHSLSISQGPWDHRQGRVRALALGGGTRLEGAGLVTGVSGRTRATRGLGLMATPTAAPGGLSWGVGGSHLHDFANPSRERTFVNSLGFPYLFRQD